MGGCVSAEANPADIAVAPNPVTEGKEEGIITNINSSPLRPVESMSTRSRRPRRKSSKGSEGLSNRRGSKGSEGHPIRQPSKGSEFSSTVDAAWTSTLPQSIPNFVCAREQGYDNPFVVTYQRTASNLDHAMNTHHAPLWVSSTIQSSFENEDVLSHSPKLFKKLNHQQSAESLVSDVVAVHDESEIIF